MSKFHIKSMVACFSANKIHSLMENLYPTSYPDWTASLWSEYEKEAEKVDKALVGPEKG